MTTTSWLKMRVGGRVDVVYPVLPTRSLGNTGICCLGLPVSGLLKGLLLDAGSEFCTVAALLPELRVGVVFVFGDLWVVAAAAWSCWAWMSCRCSSVTF